MKCTGTIKECLIGESEITLIINEKKTLSNEINKLKDKKLTIEIKQYRKHRSKNSNSYAWKLCTEIAELFGRTKDDIYLMMLKGYGQSMLTPPIKKEVNVEGYFKYYDVDYENDEYKIYKVYKGSSEYDTYEMSKFIEGIVQECKDLGIETATPDEIARMNALWEEERKRGVKYD